jgi:hypothetical protein
MHLMLGIHHTKVWNRVFQHGRGWLSQILLWGLLSGRWHGRTWPIHGVSHPFEVGNLGEMVSIVTILTTKRIIKVWFPICYVFFVTWMSKTRALTSLVGPTRKYIG